MKQIKKLLGRLKQITCVQRMIIFWILCIMAAVGVIPYIDDATRVNDLPPFFTWSASEVLIAIFILIGWIIVFTFVVTISVYIIRKIVKKMAKIK